MGVNKRNDHIDLLRFFAALLIIMQHTSGLSPEDPKNYPFCGAYLAVEFFLILSGYYAVSSNEKAPNILSAATVATLLHPLDADFVCGI